MNGVTAGLIGFAFGFAVDEAGHLVERNRVTVSKSFQRFPWWRFFVGLVAVALLFVYIQSVHISHEASRQGTCTARIFQDFLAAVDERSDSVKKSTDALQDLLAEQLNMLEAIGNSSATQAEKAAAFLKYLQAASKENAAAEVTRAAQFANPYPSNADIKACLGG